MTLESIAVNAEPMVLPITLPTVPPSLNNPG